MESMKNEPERNQSVLLEPEEYKAIMSELPPPEDNPDYPGLEERVRKIEFCMLIIIGLILIVFLFYRK